MGVLFFLFFSYPCVGVLFFSYLSLGYSARLAFGCNVGAFYSGIATGSLHGWVWLLFAFVGSMWGVRLRPHLLHPAPTPSLPLSRWFEITGGMPFAHLLLRLSPTPVYPTTAHHCGTLVDFLRPTLHVFVILYLQKLSGVIEPA